MLPQAMPRRRASVLVAMLVLSAAVLVPVTNAAAQSSESDLADVERVRYGGADRYATSLLIAEAVAADAGGELEWVVMVSGRSWHEAVVAASVAAHLEAPVLMTPPDAVRSDALGFLDRVGASKVLLVSSGAGSTRTITSAVDRQLREAGIAVERIEGDDRYRTGVAVAERLGEVGNLGGVSTAIVASGEVFADALVAGPMSAHGAHPVLLTPSTGLHRSVADYLVSERIERVVLMGGTAALPQEVENAISELGISADRVAGPSRFETATRFAEYAAGQLSNGCFAQARVGLARARVPFDSFSAAPLLARRCAALVLTSPSQIPPSTADYLDTVRHSAGDNAAELLVFGGEAAVSTSAINAYLGRGGDGSEGSEAEVANVGPCGGTAADPPTRLVNGYSQHPTWSPDCRKIAYTNWSDLIVANADGSDPRRILSATENGGYVAEPAWSPDGTRIAYAQARRVTRGGTGAWEVHIWVASADGSDRAMLTSGDVRDSRPTWSLDGKQIAFDRDSGSDAAKNNGSGNATPAGHVVAVMDADGTDIVALTEGGYVNTSPAWSPDGTKIAYISGGSVRVMRVDGTRRQVLTSGADAHGGLAWSPDGTRIAFARPIGTSPRHLFTVEVDTLREHQITDLDGWARDPRWSPDGQLIAFTHYPTADVGYRPGTQRVSVVGAAGVPVKSQTDCRPANPRGSVSAGLPLPEWSPPATGTLRVAVLFVDFPDARAKHSTHSEAGEIPWAEDALEGFSGGKLDVQFEVLHEWLTAEHSWQSYGGGNWLGVDASQLSVDLAAGKIDFSDIDMVMTVFPSDQFSIATALGGVHIGGREIQSIRLNVRNRLHEGWGRRAVTPNGLTVVHETLHVLGLADLYGSRSDPTPARRDGSALVAFDFGIMGLDAYVYVDQDDPVLAGHSAYGPDQARVDYWLRFYEMLAWSRWQLGWLDDDQARCLTADEARVTLTPLAPDADGLLMAAVPIGRNRVIVVEARANDRWRPRFANAGVLVYTVDTGRPELPVEVAVPDGSEVIPRLPLLIPGESLRVWGHKIRVTRKSGSAYEVLISKVTPGR